MNFEGQQKTIPIQEESSAGLVVQEKLSEEERRFKSFADDTKAHWAEMGVNPLVEAEGSKSSAEADLEREKQSFEKYVEKVEGLRADIDQKKSRWINRILEFRQIQALEADLRIAERSRDAAEKMMKSHEELLSAYDRIIAGQQELGALTEEAYAENAAWDENKRLELIEEEKKRDVENLMREHKTYFVHAISSEWKPSANNRSVDTKNLTWEDQLDIVSGLSPTVSVSTLDQGSSQRTFAGQGWGVLLSGGRALGGGRDDVGTIATGLRDRRFMSEGDATVGAVESAILSREGTRYNEIIIEEPKVAGVFIKWSGEMPELAQETSVQNGGGVRYDSWWQRIQSVRDRELPIFVLDTNNEAHMIYDIDAEKRTFKVTPVISPEELIDRPEIGHQMTGEKKKAVGRVFDSVSHLLTEEERMQFAPSTERESEGI